MKNSSSTTRELSILGAMVAVAGLALLVVNVEPPHRTVAGIAQVSTRNVQVGRDEQPRASGRIMAVSPSGPAIVRNGN